MEESLTQRPPSLFASIPPLPAMGGAGLSLPCTGLVYMSAMGSLSLCAHVHECAGMFLSICHICVDAH